MSVIFFTDRALGKTFPRRLRDAGVRVEVHSDHFRHDVSDIEWIQRVAKAGWYALSQDKRIYKNPLERKAVLDHGLGYFVLSGGHLGLTVIANNFLLTLPSVLRFIERQERPFIASITRSQDILKPGRVNKRYPKDSNLTINTVETE